MNHKGDFAAAAQTLEDGVARICRLYGVNPLAGRLYAVLFLATRPLSLEELCERVEAAKSTVSVALRKLVSWRVARRLPPQRGDRRDFYEAVTDPWVVLADWTQLYFRPELDMWRDASRALQGALASADDAPPHDDNETLRARLALLDELMQLVENMLGTLSRSAPGRERARTIAIRKDGDPT